MIEHDRRVGRLLKAIDDLDITAIPFVVTSIHGTRYNKNSKINDFKDIREKVGVTEVTFSQLRDGGHTAASNESGVVAKFAGLLAGNKTGMKEKDAFCNPRIVKIETDAVHAANFG